MCWLEVRLGVFYLVVEAVLGPAGGGGRGAALTPGLVMNTHTASFIIAAHRPSIGHRCD